MKKSWPSSMRRKVKKEDKGRLKEVSKKIKKCIRDEKIQRVLEEFKGIKNISNIKSVRKKHTHPKGKK